MPGSYHLEVFHEKEGREMAGILKDDRLERVWTPNGPHSKLSLGISVKGKFARAGMNFNITLECDQNREKIVQARELALELAEEGLVFAWGEFMNDLQSAAALQRLKDAVEEK